MEISIIVLSIIQNGLFLLLLVFASRLIKTLEIETRLTRQDMPTPSTPSTPSSSKTKSTISLIAPETEGDRKKREYLEGLPETARQLAGGFYNKSNEE